MCKLLTEEEFEYQTKMGNTRDAAVLGVGYARWRPNFIYEAAQDNTSVFVHPGLELSIEEDPSFYKEAVEAQVKSMISDGKSFRDIERNTIHTLPSGSNISVQLDDNNQVHIETKITTKEGYLNTTHSMALDHFFINMSKKPEAQFSIDKNPEFGFLLNDNIDYNYYYDKSDRAKEISGLDNAISSEERFNWSIPIGLIGTTLSAGTEYADNLVRTSFKTNRNPFSWAKLAPNKQVWRVNNILGKGARYVKYAKKAGIVGTVISIGMAGNDIASGEGTTIDYLDIGMGTASLGAVIFLSSNPVGWVIGTGTAIYFGGRLIYDIYEEIND